MPAVRIRLGEGALVYGVAAATYMCTGLILVYGFNVIDGDNLARVYNAFVILFSRDPHLAAVGFVWNPLPSLVEMPLTALKAWWPDIVRLGLAGNIMATAFMAGAVYQFNRTFADMRLPLFPRLAFTVLVGFHPFLLWYAGIGLSEGPMLFFLAMAARYALRWLETGSTDYQVVAGLALAFAYLTRYEPLLSGAGLVAFFFMATFLRTRATFRQRLALARMDAVIVGAPIALAFAIWTMSSWIIVGHPFEQLSSVYGNSTLIKLLVQSGGGSDIINLTGVNLGAASRAASRLLVAEPLGLVIAGMALLEGAWRRDLRPLAVIAVFGPLLAFQMVGYVFGMTGLLVRYYIAIVPMTVLLAGLLVSPRMRRERQQVEGPGAPSRGRVFMAALMGLLSRTSTAGLTLCLLVMLAVALPVSVAGLVKPSVAPYDARFLKDVLPHWAGGTVGPRQPFTDWVLERKIAEYLDRMELPRGSVLLDAGSGFAIPLASTRPEQFVVTSDRDYLAVLDDPVQSGVQLILVPENSGRGTIDAVNRTFPLLYSTGAGIPGVAQLEGTFGQWKLYRVRAR
jgi:hypothetical protein